MFREKSNFRAIKLNITSDIENFENEIKEYNEYLKSIKKNFRILDSKPLHIMNMENNKIESSFKIQWVEENKLGIEIWQ